MEGDGENLDQDAPVNDAYTEVFGIIRTRLERQFNQMTYAEAADILSRIGFSLENAKKTQAREEIRWGWGRGWNAEQIEAQLETCQISTRELLKIVECMKAGKRFQVIFSFDNSSKSLMTNERNRLRNQFIGILYDLGIPNENWKYEEQLLPHFGYLTGAIVDDPTIIFTPDDRNVPNEMQNHSPNEWYTLLGKSREEYERETSRAWSRLHDQFLRPSEWLMLFLRSIDDGLRALYPMNQTEYYRFRRDVIRQDRRIDQYLLDLETTTLFPHWRNHPDIAYGEALRLKSKSGGRGIAVVGCTGEKVYPSCGPRMALGR